MTACFWNNTMAIHCRIFVWLTEATSSGSSISPVNPIYQPLQLRVGGGRLNPLSPGAGRDLPSLTALPLATHVSLRNQLPTSKHLLLLAEGGCFRDIICIAFLISLLDRSRYLKRVLRVWFVNPLGPTLSTTYAYLFTDNHGVLFDKRMMCFRIILLIYS